MNKTNHPGKGSRIWIEPIRCLDDIRKIKQHLAGRTREYVIFMLGIHTGMRAHDLLRITVGQVRNLQPGEQLAVTERKSGRTRNFNIDRTVHEAIQKHLLAHPTVRDDDYLFCSQKGRQPLCISYLNRMIKQWCRELNLVGNFGSHTLRKTFGYLNFTCSGADLRELMDFYGHFGKKQTMAYLGITDDYRADGSIPPAGRSLHRTKGPGNSLDKSKTCLLPF